MLASQCQKCNQGVTLQCQSGQKPSGVTTVSRPFMYTHGESVTVVIYHHAAWGDPFDDQLLTHELALTSCAVVYYHKSSLGLLRIGVHRHLEFRQLAPYLWRQLGKSYHCMASFNGRSRLLRRGIEVCLFGG